MKTLVCITAFLTHSADVSYTLRHQSTFFTAINESYRIQQ